MKKILLSFTLFIFHFSLLYASHQRADSLLVLLNNDKADTARVSHLNALCLAYCATGKTDSALLLGKQALALARQLGYSMGTGDADNCIATAYFSKKDYDNSLVFFRNALEAYKKIGFKGTTKAEGVIACIGFIYESRGDYSKALQFYNKSLQMARTGHDKNGIAVAICNIGNIYAMQGENAKAMECYLKSLSLREQAGDMDEAAKSASNIGLQYQNQGDYTRALEYYNIALTYAGKAQNKYMQATTDIKIGNIYHDNGELKDALDYDSKALQLATELQSKSLLASANSAMGLVFWGLTNYSKALDYYNTALDLAKETGDKSAQATILGDIGIVRETQGDFPGALDDEFKSLSLSRELGDKNGVTVSNGSIGGIYIKQKKYKDAEKFILQALYLADTIHLLQSVKESSLDLSKLFEQTGQWQKALEAYKKYSAASDSLYSATTHRLIAKMQGKAVFDMESVVQHVNEQKEEELEHIRSKYHKIFLGLIGFILLAGLGGIFILFRLKVLQFPPNEYAQKPKTEEKE